MQELADSVGYAVRIDGPRFGEDLSVGIEADDTRIVDIFRALGDQMGSRATVEVDPLHHEVRVIHHV